MSTQFWANFFGFGSVIYTIVTAFAKEWTISTALKEWHREMQTFFIKGMKYVNCLKWKHTKMPILNKRNEISRLGKILYLLLLFWLCTTSFNSTFIFIREKKTYLFIIKYAFYINLQYWLNHRLSSLLTY